MNILYRISVIALYFSLFYEAEGQATCALAYEDGTEVTSLEWSWGLTLDAIEDVTEPGTVLVNLTATNINVIWSSEPDSTSGHLFVQPVLTNGQFVVTVTDYFTQYEELETETTIRVTLRFGCSVNNRTLNLAVPVIDTNNHYPEFQNAPYVYEVPIPLPSGFSVQLFGEISARDIDLTNTNISFTLNSSDPNANRFFASWLSQDATDKKLHYAQLLTTALLSIENDLSFAIYATDNGSPPLTSETNITIVVDKENSVPVSPVFAHHVYIADHSAMAIEEANGTEITFVQGDVSLSQGFDSTVSYTIVDNTGDYKENFLITISEDYSSINMQLQNVTDKFLAEKYVVLTLTAERSGAADVGVTILHIDLPGIINSCNSSNNETITEGTLSFSSSVFRHDKNSTFVGVLMTQTAVLTDAEGIIVYRLTFDDDDLASQITINSNTAQVEITSVISPGMYTFQILATVEELNLNASATVILVISTLSECNGEIVFGYALQVIELEEESVHENILPFNDNGCNYTIYSQTPSQNLFSMSYNSLNSVAIDREASYFKEMSVAQVRLIIDAICSEENSTDHSTTRSKRNTEYEVLTDNIPYERTRTVLIVIITDINDNPPVWSSDTPSYIGFPGYELAQLIHVPYVYRFTATDADIDDNAIVTYSLPNGSDDTFYIHSSEGTLYIRKGAYVEDGLEFTIIASDGLFETSTALNVRMLESSNVVVLFVSGGVLEDVDNIVRNLSTSTGYWINSLGSAVISESDVRSTRSLKSVTRRMKRASDANTLLRLLIYGLENNKPLTTDTLVSSLETADFAWTILESAALQELFGNSTTDDSVPAVDTHGYWATIIVLSVLLFLVFVSAGVAYYLFYRRGKATSVESDVTYENFENINSKESERSHKVRSVTLSESHDNSTESTDTSNADSVFDETKLPEKLNFENSRTFRSLKGCNDDDDDDVCINQNENLANVSPQPVKKKSVAFNNTVEEIEVARL